MKRVEILIDDEPLVIDQGTSAAISHEIADIEEPDKSLTGSAKDIEAPYNERNRKIMQFSEQVLSRVLFNNSKHTAKILENGNLVMYGSAQVDKYIDRGHNFGHYSLKVLGASADWVKRASNGLLKDLKSDFSVKYLLRDVYNNSILTSPTLIKFFPVDRGAFYIQDAQGEYKERSNIDLADYHPFINIWLLLILIFEGYTINSSMKPLFEKIYMTGFVPEQDDIEGIEADNDFNAGTTLNLDIIAATLNTTTTSQLINVFDNWKATTDNGLFVATEGILKTVNGVTVFAPTVACTTLFKMALTYITSVGENGEYVDTLKFGSGNKAQVLSLSPLMSDEYDAEFGNVPLEALDEPTPSSGNYKIARYLWFIRLKRPTDYAKIIKKEWSASGSTVIGVTRPKDYVLADAIETDGQWIHVHVGKGKDKVYNCQYVLEDINGKQVEISPALLEDNNIVAINDNGTISFTDIEFNTLSYNIDSGRALPLGIEFSISSRTSPSASLNLYIGEQCTIAPDFRNAFAYGSNISISVVGGSKTQIQFIKALRQLFNLYFYTNPLTKEVFVEPRPKFYFPLSQDNANVIDWTDRIDYSHEVENEQLGNNIGDALKLAYADGNDVVKKYNRRNKCTLGTFETPLENKTTEGAKELTNQMFTPFVRRPVKSMGWTVLQNVLETEQGTVSDIDFDLSITLGIFSGITDRIAGTDRATYPKYPVLVFQEGNHNMGFEDVVNGSEVVKGLHQYYDTNIKQYNRSRRITAYLNLNAIDIENIQCPSGACADFRSVFLLKHKGETLYLELEKIVDYNPSSGESTKCSFITKVED